MDGQRGKVDAVDQRPLLFICKKRMLFVGVHTDDTLMVGKKPALEEFKKQFNAKFPIKFLEFPRLWRGLQMARVDGTIYYLHADLHG